MKRTLGLLFPLCPLGEEAVFGCVGSLPEQIDSHPAVIEPQIQNLKIKETRSDHENRIWMLAEHRTRIMVVARKPAPKEHPGSQDRPAA